jgi:uncharacterized protein YukE
VTEAETAAVRALEAELDTLKAQLATKQEPHGGPLALIRARIEACDREHFQYDSLETAYADRRDLLAWHDTEREMHAAWRKRAEEAEVERDHLQAALVALQQQVAQLVTMWEGAAEWEFENGSPEFGKGLDQCADELRARLTPAPSPPQDQEGV